MTEDERLQTTARDYLALWERVQSDGRLRAVFTGLASLSGALSHLEEQ